MLPAVSASAESRAKKVAAAAAADSGDADESESSASAAVNDASEDSESVESAAALPRAFSASEMQDVEQLSRGFYYRPDHLKSLGISEDARLTRGRRQEHVANIIAGGSAMLSPPSKATAAPISPGRAKAASPAPSARVGAAAANPPAPKPAVVPASKKASIDGISLDVAAVRLRGPSGAFVPAQSQPGAQVRSPKKTPATLAASPAASAKQKKTGPTIEAVHGMDKKEEYYVVSYSNSPSTLVWKAADSVERSLGGAEAITAFRARYSAKDVFELPEY